MQVGNRVSFLRTFGPTWQNSMMRGHFGDEPDIARAKKSYQAPPSSSLLAPRACSKAAEDNEISFRKGDKIEITEIQGYWMRGTLEDGSSGFLRKKDVDLKMKNFFKCLSNSELWP